MQAIQCAIMRNTDIILNILKIATIDSFIISSSILYNIYLSLRTLKSLKNLKNLASFISLSNFGVLLKVVF